MKKKVFENVMITIVNVVIWSVVILVMRGAIIPFRIVSNSMNPSIKVNDIVIIKRENGERFMTGDIIAFKAAGVVVVHRIHSMEEGQIFTKGDHNNAQDPFVLNTEEIIGKAIFRIPLIGYVYELVLSKIGKGIIGGAVLAIGITLFFEWQFPINRKEEA